jgi:hypothetical protein
MKSAANPNQNFGMKTHNHTLAGVLQSVVTIIARTLVTFSLTAAICLSAVEPENSPKVLNYLESYNVVWDSQSRNSAEAMPLVGGQIGCNVWVENGDLLIYAQQSGAFDKNGEYMKMGRFRIKLNPNPFTLGTTFKQELKLKEGFVQITGATPEHGKVVVNLWVEVKRPVIHVDVQAEQKLTMTAAYESWRFKDMILPPEKKLTLGRRASVFDYDGWQSDVIKKADAIEPGKDCIVWYQDNGRESNAFQFAVRSEGLENIKNQMWDPLENLISGGMMKCSGLKFTGTTHGTYFQTPFEAWNYKSVRKSKTFALEIFGQIEKSNTADEWKAKLNNWAGAEVDRTMIWNENQAWWNEFWTRSYVVINPGRNAVDVGWRVGRNFSLFRYVLGGNTYGKAPTKFNGGNLTFDPGFVNTSYPYDPDFRRWGGWSFTSANQRLVYWPFLKNGDFEAMLPEFDVYRRGLTNAEARTRVHFGHEGCSFAEQYQYSGMPVVSHYGWVTNGFGWTIRPTNTVDGELPNPWIATFYHGQLEHAFMILEYYRFSGRDISSYLPFIISSVKFYDQHYQMIHQKNTGQPLDEQGKLVIYPSTASEAHLNSTNPADAVAGLTAITKAVLDLPPSLLTPEQRAYFAGFQKRIPELPVETSEVDGQQRTILKYSLYDESKGAGFFPNLHATFPYNLIYLGSPNFGGALDTWLHNVAPASRKQFAGFSPSVVYSARMGLADEAQYTISHKLDDSVENGCRFPSFWGPGNDWAPDHNWGGSGLIGLQEMLLQTPGNEIRLLPAWPKGWDVNFKLHAPENTVIECVYRAGKLEKMDVTPKRRAQDIITLTPQ